MGDDIVNPIYIFFDQINLERTQFQPENTVKDKLNRVLREIFQYKLELCGDLAILWFRKIWILFKNKIVFRRQ